MTVITRDSILTDLGTVVLFPRADTLTAVIVTPRALPPKMHGDTLEYATSHIKTRVNANVEELLARLPGVQVDQNGGIKVNGKKVERLLVDGEDLFAGDPTIVTRNFNADMIAKVQVLDKKSAQAEFTGVDDGQTTKTINLALKDDSKRGYFLKTEAGGGPQGYYNLNGLLGSFKGYRQFAALGMMANTGATSFNGNVGDLGSGLNIGSGTNDALRATAGNGIPRVGGGGMHYANKWNGNEDHLVGNYSYGQLTTSPYSTMVTSQILTDSIYIQRQQSSSVNTQNQHALNADYDYIPDSISAFRFSLGGASMQGHNDFSSIDSSSFNDTLVNSSLRTIRSDVENQQFRGSIMWRIRGREKKDRNFSVLAGMARQSNNTGGFLYSRNNFYQGSGALLYADTTDQRKVIDLNGLFFNSSLNYTEPLWKDAVLAVTYGLSFNKAESSQSTYNRNGGKYDDYVDSLSNHYQNNVLTQRATVNLQMHDKTFGFTMGGDILYYAYRQLDKIKDSVLRYQYINFTPRINGRYKIDNYKGFDLNYNTSTQQPSITQLQPVQNNNDPLHITLGNPHLHASFSHNLDIGFYSLKPWVTNVGVNFGLTTNTISTKSYTDSLGRQVSEAVNVNGTYRAGSYFSISKKIKPIDLDLGLNTGVSYNRSVNYVNQYLSRNDSYNAGAGFSLNKFVADKYSCQLNAAISYSYSRSSINLSAPTHYWIQDHNAQVSLFPLPGFEINTGAFFNWRQKLNNFDKKNSTLMWNAYVGKNFLKNQLTIRWQVNDILGQNAGISRNITANQTIESTFNVIGRYWALSATWRFMHHRKID